MVNIVQLETGQETDRKQHHHLLLHIGTIEHQTIWKRFISILLQR